MGVGKLCKIRNHGRECTLMPSIGWPAEPRSFRSAATPFPIDRVGIGFNPTSRFQRSSEDLPKISCQLIRFQRLLQNYQNSQASKREESSRSQIRPGLGVVESGLRRDGFVLDLLDVVVISYGFWWMPSCRESPITFQVANRPGFLAQFDRIKSYQPEFCSTCGNNSGFLNHRKKVTDASEFGFFRSESS